MAERDQAVPTDHVVRPQDLDAVARQFQRFAVHTRGYSPLYERLSLSIAGDPDLLEMATYARPGQLPPNLLFGAVHYLLLRGTEHPVARYYPSLYVPGSSARVASDEDPYPAFRAFCLEYRGQVEALVRTRLVQTNEVGRCACLLPAFALAMRQVRRERLALVEIGASAGLNLLWDHYGYNYDGALRWGDPSAPVQITCALRGSLRLPLPVASPQVTWRVGLDLNPVDVRNADATLWLRALIWPDHQQRAAMLVRAIEEARRDPPRLVAGNALDHLPEELAEAPTDAALCVFHCWTVNQFSAEARQQLSDQLRSAATRRPLLHIAIEPHGNEDYSEVCLATYTGGERSEQVLGRCHSHGVWLEWLERA